MHFDCLVLFLEISLLLGHISRRNPLRQVGGCISSFQNWSQVYEFCGGGENMVLGSFGLPSDGVSLAEVGPSGGLKRLVCVHWKQVA